METKTVEEEEKRKREKKRRGRKKKKRKSKQSQAPKRYGTNLDSMRFGMDLWVCMMIHLLKPRVLLEFHLNPKIMESKVGKTPNVQEKHGILPFEVRFTV